MRIFIFFYLKVWFLWNKHFIIPLPLPLATGYLNSWTNIIFFFLCFKVDRKRGINNVTVTFIFHLLLMLIFLHKSRLVSKFLLFLRGIWHLLLLLLLPLCCTYLLCYCKFWRKLETEKIFRKNNIKVNEIIFILMSFSYA